VRIRLQGVRKKKKKREKDGAHARGGVSLSVIRVRTMLVSDGDAPGGWEARIPWGRAIIFQNKMWPRNLVRCPQSKNISAGGPK
jgi:hypothetical protein